ncbi:hypothetical protein U9M48_008327, partial [Paspalum notatum var. saurae]
SEPRHPARAAAPPRFHSVPPPPARPHVLLHPLPSPRSRETKKKKKIPTTEITPRPTTAPVPPATPPANPSPSSPGGPPGCGIFSTKSASDRHWGRIACPGFGAFPSFECRLPARNRRAFPQLAIGRLPSLLVPVRRVLLKPSCLICIGAGIGALNRTINGATSKVLALRDCQLRQPGFSTISFGCDRLLVFINGTVNHQRHTSPSLLQVVGFHRWSLVPQSFVITHGASQDQAKARFYSV